MRAGISVRHRCPKLFIYIQIEEAHRAQAALAIERASVELERFVAWSAPVKIIA